MFVVLACEVSNAARPGFVPPNANWRIDRHYDTPANQTAGWQSIGVYEGGNWGQGACVAPGASCHLNDYCTWWYIYAPAPPSGYTPVEWGTTSFPAGYNPSTGLYYY
jgi:hypothetical protein